MMKRKIIFGSLLSVFILMMLPAIPAVEYNEAVNKSNLIDKVQNININKFKERIQKIDIQNLKKEIKNINMEGTIGVVKEKLKDNLPQPQCITFFIILIILFKIFGNIISLIFAVVSKIIDIAGAVLDKLVIMAIAIIKPVIKLTVMGLMAYFSIAAVIDLFFLCVFLLLILIKGGS